MRPGDDCDLGEHGVDERGLDADVLIRWHRASSGRAARGSAARAAFASSWSRRSRFAKTFGIRALNASSRASASSRSEISTWTCGCASSAGSPSCSGPFVVVEEVLLELVEDEERSRPSRTPASAGSDAHSSRTDDLGVRRDLAQPPRDAGARGATSCRRRSRRRAPSAATRAGSRRRSRVSRSRPKKSSASSSESSNGARPLYGATGRAEALTRCRRRRSDVAPERARRTRRAATRAGRRRGARQNCALERLRLGLHRPGPVAERLRAPQMRPRTRRRFQSRMP